MLISGTGGTSFPIRTIQNMLEKTKNKIITVIITDGEISNVGQTMDYFRNYLNDGNKLFIFLQNKKLNINAHYKELSNFGAKIVVALTAKEMCDNILEDI